MLRIAGGTSGILIGLYVAGLSNGGAPLDAAFAGTLGAVSFASELVASLPLGMASDRFGRRRLMTGGALLGACAALLLAGSAAVPVFVVSRALEGLTAAAIVPALLAYLADATEQHPALRARAMSFFELTLLAGLAFGGLAAAQLFRFFHAGAFTVVSFVYCACALVLWINVDETVARHARNPIAGVARALRVPAIGRLAPVWLCVNAIIGLWLGPTLPFLLTQRAPHSQYLAGIFAADPARVGWLLFGYALVFGAGVTVWSFVLPHVRLRVALWISLGAMLPACGGIYALNHSAQMSVGGRWTIGVFMSVVIMVESGFTPAALAWLARSLPVRSGRGAAMGLYSVLLSVGAIAGSLLAAVLGRRYAIDGLLYATVLAAVLAIAFLRSVPEPQPHRAGRAA